jgi:hypothetical protein
VIKLFAIAFTCVYLHLSVGVVKTTHYCMGRESSSSFYTFKAKRCACDLFLSNLEKNTCCHDESELIILDDDQSVAQFLFIHAPEYFPMIDLYKNSVEAEQKYHKNIPSSPDYIPPPKEPLYTVYCSLRLYESAC